MAFVIDIANDISGLSADYQQAITTAINFFETHITTNETVSLNFDWSALGAGALAQSSIYYLSYTYSQVYQAIQAVDGSPTASAVQKAAALTLKTNFPTDPTKGGQFWLTIADARALGLNAAPAGSITPVDSTITLNSNDQFTWSQSGGIAANTYDAVGAIEHEISEALGRTAFLGGAEFGATPAYNILDMFHYAAAGKSSNAPPGSAAGALDEPFVPGYQANVQAYFSYDGSTVTLPFGSPSEVAAGDDVADWKSTVIGDSFGFAFTGTVGAISATDLQTLNVLGYSVAASCFCAGTLIKTPRGEIAVERLRSGDLVTTHDGRQVPVSWLGVQTISRRFADPLRVRPIRVRAGALGDNIPCRDLLLSPDHALYIDEVQFHAGALVNGTSIIRETATPEVFVYYHVETADHSLILAEGAPAETFIDNTDRMRFDNWAEHYALYPEGKPMMELPYPRAKSRRQVPMHIRIALDERAKNIGAAKIEAA